MRRHPMKLKRGMQRLLLTPGFLLLAPLLLQLSPAAPCTADERSFLKDYLCKPRSLIFRREHPLVRGWLCATRCWRTQTEPTGFWRYGWEFGWRLPRSNALANSAFFESTKFNRPTWPDAVQW